MTQSNEKNKLSSLILPDAKILPEVLVAVILLTLSLTLTVVALERFVDAQAAVALGTLVNKAQEQLCW